MNRRAFLLTTASVALVASASPLVVSEFEITLANPDEWVISARHDLHLWPWQTRLVRQINGRDWEWVALTEEYPEGEGLARLKKQAEAAYQRAKVLHS